MMHKPRQQLGLLLLLCVVWSASWAETWTVNFKDTDIQEVVRFVAQATGKTVVVDPRLKGNVQVISSEPVDRDGLWDLFLSVLEANDFAAVDSGGLVRIVPLKDARTAPVPVRDGTSRDSGNRSNAEMITEVIQLRNISAAKLIPVLRPLAPQQAHMAAYGPSNAIIMSDTAANIARIRDVIDRIDKAAVEETQIIKLKHASAEETVRMLTQLQQVQQAQAQGEGKTIVLVADKRTNSVLVSADEMERRRIASLLEHLDSPLAQSGNVQVVYLRYANAKDVSEVLSKVVQNIERMAEQVDATKAAAKKADASVEADEGTNSLIITADADVMASLLAVVERLDIRRAQVLVEAVIVELSDTTGRDLGIQWLFLDESGAYGASNSGSALQRNLATGALGQGGSNGDAAFLGALTGTPGQLIGVGRTNGGFTFNTVLNALQSNDDANILSTPSLLTLDNEEAEIIVGQNVPFITGSYSNTGGSSSPDSPFQTIERQDVGVTLRVTPHVNEGDSLVLNIEQEVSSLFGTSSEVEASDIITNERRIKTKVLVDDGQMIVLGGLIQDDVQQGVQKVPFLGDVPVLGRLFRSNSTTKTKTHLMVFLRPKIIRDSRSLTGATAEKYQYIREQQLGRRGEDHEFLKEGELPLLPEWEEELARLREVQEENARRREEASEAVEQTENSSEDARSD